MSGVAEFIITHLKEVLFTPKDQFERAKRNASRLLIPLSLIVGGESVFVAILSAIQTLQITIGHFAFKLVGVASDSFYTLAGVTLVAYLTFIGANLYYAHLIRQSSKEIETLNRDLRNSDAYNQVRKKYFEYIEVGETEKAFTIADIMARLYLNEVKTDGEFLSSILSNVETPRLAGVRQMLIATKENIGSSGE